MRVEMSWRSISRQVEASVATAVVLWGTCVEHGGEAEEVAVVGLVDEDLLLVFVDGGDFDGAGEEDVGGGAGVAELVDALAGGEGAELDLGGEDAELIVIEEGEEGDVAEFVRRAGHGGWGRSRGGPPRGVEG